MVPPPGKVARNRLLWRVGLLLILLLAAGLRFSCLDAQSFWNDEGNSARIAERSIRLILAGAAGDIHPPLYYLALHYWRALTGPSEFALRAFSAIGGVALVALIALLGARFFARPPGLAAGFLAAIIPSRSTIVGKPAPTSGSHSSPPPPSTPPGA